VDIILPNLQKYILEGKDIHLATLLIPFFFLVILTSIPLATTECFVGQSKNGINRVAKCISLPSKIYFCRFGNMMSTFVKESERTP
jgi:hypothetical protein